MAKDPAFLFYPGDFNTGTQFFTDEQVGKYIRLLMAQHQHGHLSDKQVINICKSYDNDVMAKFSKDKDGLWFNERLENEIVKRKNYSLSRSDNRTGKTKTSKTYDKHMENENEDIDVNKNNTVLVGDSSSSNFIVVKAKYAYEKNYKVFGVDGLRQYLESKESKLTSPNMAPKFMATNDGQHFTDLPHLKNAYKLFVKNEFK